ncbi:hypothetical protein ABTK60_20500, partial [Acinetobacter baumannii]
QHFACTPRLTERGAAALKAGERDASLLDLPTRHDAVEPPQPRGTVRGKRDLLIEIAQLARDVGTVDRLQRRLDEGEHL